MQQTLLGIGDREIIKQSPWPHVIIGSNIYMNLKCVIINARIEQWPLRMHKVDVLDCDRIGGATEIFMEQVTFDLT